MLMPEITSITVRCVVHHFFDLLKIRKLLQMKLVHLAVDHCTYCKVPDDVLKQDEYGHDDGDSTLQWRDYRCLIKQQKQHKRRLQQQGQQPEASQLRYLCNKMLSSSSDNSTYLL